MTLVIKHFKLILLSILLTVSLASWAKGFTITPTLTVEEQQRFKYYFYEAERLFQNEEYPLAYNLLQFCYMLNPNDAMVNLYLGTFLEGYRQSDKALPYFRRAYQMNPDDLWSQYTIALFNSETEDNRKECIRILEAMTKKQSPASGSPTDMASVWDNLRQAYTATHEYKKALHAQDELDKIEGYNGMSAINRYRIHVLMQKPKDAIADINRYLEEDPTNLQFHLFRIQLYEYIHVSIGTLYPAYEQILELDPYNALVLNNYAYHLATHGGDLRRAEQMSQRAIQIESENPTYLDTYAWVLYLQGQKSLAEFYIRRAISLIPADKVPEEIQVHLEEIIGL